MKEKENGHKNRQGRLYYGSLSLAYYRHLSTEKKTEKRNLPNKNNKCQRYLCAKENWQITHNGKLLTKLIFYHMEHYYHVLVKFNTKYKRNWISHTIKG